MKIILKILIRMMIGMFGTIPRASKRIIDIKHDNEYVFYHCPDVIAVAVLAFRSPQF